MKPLETPLISIVGSSDEQWSPRTSAESSATLAMYEDESAASASSRSSISDIPLEERMDNARLYLHHEAFMQTEEEISYTTTYKDEDSVQGSITYTVVSHSAPPEESHLTVEERKQLLETELQRRKKLPAKERGHFKPKMSHLLYSSVPRTNFSSSVTVTQDIADELGITEEGLETVTRCEFFYNGVDHIPGFVTSSEDRSSDKVILPRVMRNKRGHAICFTGRPDTLGKAREQAAYINPHATAEQPQRYLVLSLTSAASIQGATMLNERESLIDEHEALKELAQEGIYQPIHIHHCFNSFGESHKVLTDRMSGKDIERPINQNGYALLFEAARAKQLAASDNAHLQKSIEDILYYLDPSRIDNLSLEERFLLTDLLGKLSDLPVVIHCKSSVDRTSIGVAISTINQMIVEGELRGIPRDASGRFAFHELCHKESYKKLFLAHLNTQHQICGAARSGIDLKGNPIGRAHYGLNFAKSILSFPPALALMPKEALVKTHWHWSKYIITALTPLLQFIIGVPLLPLYLVALAITAIVLRLKTGEWKGQFIKTLLLLPYSIKFWKIPTLQFDQAFDRKPGNILLNKHDRHLLHHGKLRHPEASLNRLPKKQRFAVTMQPSMKQLERISTELSRMDSEE